LACFDELEQVPEENVKAAGLKKPGPFLKLLKGGGKKAGKNG
jgi:hypothetical protein